MKKLKFLMINFAYIFKLIKILKYKITYYLLCPLY